MRFSITKEDILNAIIKVSRRHEGWWLCANSANLDEEDSDYYEEKLLRKIKSYLIRRYNLTDHDLSSYDIFSVWAEYYYQIWEQVDGSIVEEM